MKDEQFLGYNKARLSRRGEGGCLLLFLGKRGIVLPINRASDNHKC